MFPIGSALEGEGAPVRHWHGQRSPHWRLRAALNGTGAVLTATAAAFIASKFTFGAWVVVLTGPALMLLFSRIQSFYQAAGHELDLGQLAHRPLPAKSLVIVPLAGQCQVRRRALWQQVPTVVTDPGRIRSLPRGTGSLLHPDQPAAPGGRRLVAMTPYAITVALFATFVVGGILAKALPLRLVAVIGLAIGLLSSSSWTAIRVCLAAGSAPPRLAWPEEARSCSFPNLDAFPRHRTRLLRQEGFRDPQKE